MKRYFKNLKENEGESIQFKIYIGYEDYIEDILLEEMMYYKEVEHCITEVIHHKNLQILEIGVEFPIDDYEYNLNKFIYSVNSLLIHNIKTNTNFTYVKDIRYDIVIDYYCQVFDGISITNTETFGKVIEVLNRKHGKKESVRIKNALHNLLTDEELYDTVSKCPNRVWNLITKIERAERNKDFLKLEIFYKTDDFDVSDRVFKEIENSPFFVTKGNYNLFKRNNFNSEVDYSVDKYEHNYTAKIESLIDSSVDLEMLVKACIKNSLINMKKDVDEDTVSLRIHINNKAIFSYNNISGYYYFRNEKDSFKDHIINVEFYTKYVNKTLIERVMLTEFVSVMNNSIVFDAITSLSNILTIEKNMAFSCHDDSKTKMSFRVKFKSKKDLNICIGYIESYIQKEILSNTKNDTIIKIKKF